MGWSIRRKLPGVPRQGRGRSRSLLAPGGQDSQPEDRKNRCRCPNSNYYGSKPIEHQCIPLRYASSHAGIMRVGKRSRNKIFALVSPILAQLHRLSDMQSGTFVEMEAARARRGEEGSMAG